MRLIKLMILIGIAGYGYQWWQKSHSPGSGDSVAGDSPNGFVRVAMPGNVPHNTILILTPENCPLEAAQQSEALAQQLSQAGVAVMRSSSFNLSIDNPTEADRQNVQRTTEVFNAGPPAVFLNGMGKSKPTADEVLAEFRRTR